MTSNLFEALVIIKLCIRQLINSHESYEPCPKGVIEVIEWMKDELEKKIISGENREKEDSKDIVFPDISNFG